MERDSFIFYKSFYEALADLPSDVRLEVLTAVIEYALYGRQPDNLKPIAKGMFTLMKPNIDVNNTRFENGKKGGRKKSVKTQAPATQIAYTLSFEEEIVQMKSDEQWRNALCEDFNISAREYDRRLDRFLDRCNDDKLRKGKDRHDSYEDCKSHFRYWMSKAYPAQASMQPPLDNESTYIPDASTDFGGMDYDEQTVL
ncbi:MAG: hypothetical protein HDR97_00460 [Bacteroides sp.]|nr:hypothetical protein [Bacteroides sp.]